MTPQDHASYLLQLWQQRRDLPPILRLVDAPSIVPADNEDEYQRDLDVLREVLAS